MEYYAGIAVSLELSSVCILDGFGQIVREAKVASEPEALATFLASLNLPLTRVGLEASSLSQWLHAGLVQAGLEVVLLETRQVQAELDVAHLCLQLLAGHEQGPHLLRCQGFAMHRSAPAHPHHLSDATGVLAIRSDRHGRERRLHLP